MMETYHETTFDGVDMWNICWRLENCLDNIKRAKAVTLGEDKTKDNDKGKDKDEHIIFLLNAARRNCKAARKALLNDFVGKKGGVTKSKGRKRVRA